MGHFKMLFTVLLVILYTGNYRKYYRDQYTNIIISQFGVKRGKQMRDTQTPLITNIRFTELILLML